MTAEQEWEWLRRYKQYIGTWRITGMEQWDAAYIDLVSPGLITFRRLGTGQFNFGCVDAEFNWQFELETNRVDFLFAGSDEGHEVTGRGWAKLEGKQLTGSFDFHQGEKSGFTAKKDDDQENRFGSYDFMSIQHTARSGKIYYLHVLPTKTGKEKYHFSTSKDGLLVRVLPEGYEIYENVNGQVFLRRKIKKLIESDELELVEKALERHAEKWLYKVEIKKENLVIYETNQNIGLDRLASWINLDAEKEFIKRHAHYQPVMRFILEDPDKRMFRAERWCFRGSVDGWMDIMTCPCESLPKLVKKFIKHLGKESFFELY